MGRYASFRKKRGSVAVNRKKRGSVTVNWQLYVMLLLPFAFLVMFSYVPMYGVQVAFQDYNVVKGMSGSPWVGLKHFLRFFADYQFTRTIANTLILSIYSIVVSFPCAIIFAIALNYLKWERYRKIVQTVSYAPYLISTVVICTMILNMLAPRSGLLTFFINTVTGAEVDLMANASAFDDIYVWSGIWQSTGFNSIIYIATLVGIDPEIHEAAVTDGATKLQRIAFIDIPYLMPTAVKLLILNMGQILNVGYEKVLLLQNNLNMASSEVVSTYVYKVGLRSTIPQFSYSTAIGLFQSVIGMVLLIIVNKVANRVSDSGIW